MGIIREICKHIEALLYSYCGTVGGARSPLHKPVWGLLQNVPSTTPNSPNTTCNPYPAGPAHPLWETPLLNHRTRVWIRNSVQVRAATVTTLAPARVPPRLRTQATL